MILIAHSYFMRHDPKQLARAMPYSPISTLIAAAMLREANHEIAYFDATFADGIGAFEHMLDRGKFDLVAIMEDNFNFITKMCTERRREDALAMIAAAKRRGCRVVVNGPDCADLPQIYLDGGAEAVLLGEGESALLEIASRLGGDAKASLADIPGLALADPQRGLRRTAPRPHQRDLDKLPLPAWDLADIDAYRDEWLLHHGRFSWNVATSRGCPYGCNWCAKPVFGRGYEQRSAEAVARELRLLKDVFKVDHIWFADDIFGLTAEWVQQFSQAVRRLNARVPFMMQSRVNLMRPDAVEALAEAGAEEIWLGVESGAQPILDAMTKGSTVAQVRTATRRLKAAGIRVSWFIQLGFPGESWEDLCLTRDLINEEQPDDIGVSVAYPLPGTRFHDMVRATLSERRNWRDSDELAMLFEGTFDTKFYRMVRDLLHDEVRERRRDDDRWALLERLSVDYRSSNPVLLATGS